jgi:small subunit ribosomal protein S16
MLAQRDGKYLRKLYLQSKHKPSNYRKKSWAVKWLHNGAQPTDTAKAILSKELYWNTTLMEGRKGALTQERW